MSESKERKCLTSWIDTYMEYTSGQESPKAFHEWTALTILSAALGRRVYIDRGFYTIYPNIFTILVAGSAKCRKSVSTGIGISLLKGMKQPPMIFSQKVTNEALIQALTEARDDGSSSGLIYSSELSSFMGADAIKSGLIPTLTDLYDSPADWSYRTRGRGVEQMKNVTLTFLAASTQEWLRSAIPIDAIGGGFTSRIIFVYQDKPSQAVLFPELNEKNAEYKQLLINDLNIIKETIKGKMTFTRAAIDYAENWYKGELFKTRDPKVEGYFGRKHDTMFKIATLISVSQSSDRVIDEKHIKQALGMMEEIECNLGMVMDTVSATEQGGTIDRVLSMIKKEGRIKHSDLLRKCWRFATADDIAIYIKTLVESKEIKETLDRDGRTRYYEKH